MKSTFQSVLLLFAILAGNFVQAQTTQNGVTEPNSSKSKYIQNQDFLSASSLKDYKSFYGDSLNGFDEQLYKTRYLNLGIYGQEFLSVMNRERRLFIDFKYGIGYGAKPKAQLAPQNPGGGNAKPIGGGNVVNMLPCINEDFESTPPGVYTTSNAVTGWTLESGLNNSTIYPPNTQYGAACVPNPVNPVTGWTPGSPAGEFSIVATPILGVPFIGNLPNSPLGGTNVARIQNTAITNGPVTRISTSFPVTNANTLFQFAYAGSWDGAHECCGQPSFRVDLYQCSGPGSLIPVPLPCANLSLTPSGPSCISNSSIGYSVTGGVTWTNWQTKYIDLTPYIGQCIKLVATVSDCSYSGHHGSAFFDARCGGQLIGSGLGGVGGNVPGAVSFCAGSNQAIISAPLGYFSYQWIAPGGFTVSAPQGIAPTLTVTSPVPGSVYTVVANSAAGCQYLITNTINFSSVIIAGIGSSSSCPGGASGSATVQGNGSGTGYNYNWLNSASVTVGTASVVTGLAPGIYSVVISGFGAAGCGSAVATVTITNAPPGIIDVYKPFCNNEAYLFAGAGSNFKWYNNTTPIPPPAGVQSSYTVNGPSNGAIFWLSYLSAQGCQDSVRFTLGLSPPGSMFVSNVSLVCPGGSNGTAQVNMTPAPGAPPGQNTYYAFSIASVTPPYTSSLSASSAGSFPLTGLSAGTYSVNTFDGSCRYSTTFVVQALTYNYTLSPSPSTLCPGNAIAAGITFSVPPVAAQYSYSWSPATWLAGNTQQSTIIMPTTPPGVVTTIIYSVTVTPAIANCPLTKTISITAANPVVPTLGAIPNMCDNASPFPIVATPGGGTFTAASANLIGPNSGVISPSFAALGVNNYTYAYSVYTCVATNTGTFQVSQFHTSALTGTVPNQCVTNSPFNLMNIVQSAVNGSWSGIGWNLASTTIFNPAPLLTGFYPIKYSTFSNPNPTVCPSTTTMMVSVTKTITPYINPVADFCNNKPSFNMTVTPSGGGWSGNGVSLGGVVTPTLYNGPGLFSATYTVADGPCVNINATPLNVSAFVSASLSSGIPYLCVTNNPFNLLSIVQNTTGSWVPGQGVNNSNMLNPFGLPSGNYTYTYVTFSTPNASLCPDSRTITTNVLNPPAPDITQVGPFCNNGMPVQLSVTPNTGSWTASPYLSNTGLFTPSLCPVGGNIVQYMIGTNTCNTTQTKQISIEAFVTAALAYNMPDQCSTGSVYNLQPVTLNNLGTWSGAGVVGQGFNPAVVGAGIVVLTYNTVSSPSGLCPDVSTMAVTVYSLASPSVLKMGPFCNSAESKQIMVSPIGGLFGGANNLAVSPQGLFNPASAIVGENIINYSITAGPCVAYAQTTISIERFVSADFEKEVGPFCRDAHSVNLNSFVQNPGGTWSGPGVNASIFTPSAANIGNNNLIVYKTTSVPTATLCPDIKEVRIKVNELPNVTVASNIYQGCSPVEVRVNMNNANTGSGVWSFGDGSELKPGLSTSYVFSTPGKYFVMFSYQDEIGCKGQAQLPSPINVFDYPQADFSAPAEVLISNPDVQFTNLTTVLVENTYLWKFGNLSQSSSAVNPLVRFDKIGRYEVTLQATTINGCKNEVTKTIEVKNDFNIYIPSSFTPNYDGLNDVFIPVFSPYGLDTKTYELEVFDRWGHSMFYTKDVTKGWDGNVPNKDTKNEQEAVYIYKIKYKDTDGNVYNKTGHVTLLK